MLRKWIYIFLALASAITIIGLLINLSLNDSIISIQNNTDANISGQKIKYSNSPDDTIIPEILPQQKYETKLILPENFTEGSIKIVYTDKLGKNHEEYLSGYVEKNSKVKINVTINSIEDNGVLTVKVR